MKLCNQQRESEDRKEIVWNWSLDSERVMNEIIEANSEKVANRAKSETHKTRGSMEMVPSLPLPSKH